MVPEKKKRGKARGKIMAGTGLAALALALGLGLNWGQGSGGGEGGRASGSPVQLSASLETSSSPAPSDAEEAAMPAAYQERLVEVAEDSIYVEGEVVGEEDLMENLLRLHEQGDVWELRNRHGRKYAYDTAKAALQELSIPFFESEE